MDKASELGYLPCTTKKPSFVFFFKSLLNLLQYCFCFMFWLFGCDACGIPASRPGIEPALSALEGEVLTTGPPGKSQKPSFFLEKSFFSWKRFFVWIVCPPWLFPAGDQVLKSKTGSEKLGLLPKARKEKLLCWQFGVFAIDSPSGGWLWVVLPLFPTVT